MSTEFQIKQMERTGFPSPKFPDAFCWAFYHKNIFQNRSSRKTCSRKIVFFCPAGFIKVFPQNFKAKIVLPAQYWLFAITGKIIKLIDHLSKKRPKIGLP